MIKMRQKEGIAIAKAKGVYSKERCKKLSLSQMDDLKADIANRKNLSIAIGIVIIMIMGYF